MPACSFPARRLLPSTALRPGFLLCASPETFRSLSRRPSELYSFRPRERPALAGSSAACRSCVAPLTCRSLPFGPSLLIAATMPSADFCLPIRSDHSFLSPVSRTGGRSPEVSSTTFDAQPPYLPPVSLMDMRFAGICQLARLHMPHPVLVHRLASLLCASFRPSVAETPLRFATLHLHQVGTGTFTPLVVKHARHRVGGSLAAPVLPHHRTYGSVYGGS